MKQLFLVFLVFGLLSSCKKEENRRCFKAGGEIVTLVRPITESFEKLKLNPRIEYVLVQDTVNKLVLKGGQNLLAFVTAEVSAGELVITNTNRCNFLRDYSRKIRCEVHFTNVWNVHFEGTEPLTCASKIVTDWFVLLVRDGAGPVNLNLDCSTFYGTMSHGYGDMTLKGKCKYLNLNIRSNTFCDASQLQVEDSMAVISNTQGDISVFSDNCVFKGETNLDGNIIYYGVPSAIQFQKYGKGNLIKGN